MIVYWSLEFQTAFPEIRNPFEVNSAACLLEVGDLHDQRKQVCYFFYISANQLGVFLTSFLMAFLNSRQMRQIYRTEFRFQIAYLRYAQQAPQKRLIEHIQQSTLNLF